MVSYPQKPLSTISPFAHSRAWRSVAAGALIAATLDLTYACVASGILGRSPVQVCQSVAAGLLGREAAFAGGLPTAALGFFLHYFMVLIMAAFYFFAATRVPLLVARPVVCGSVYGLGLYIVMNYVVLPLSAIGTYGGRGPLWVSITGILVHMFFVGWVIALFTRRAMRP